MTSAPSRRSTGNGTGGPERGNIAMRGWWPARYQVTTRVHSPASDGAICSPTRAFSNVDFPALTFPATAIRSGPSNLATWASSHAATWGSPR